MAVLLKSIVSFLSSVLSPIKLTIYDRIMGHREKKVVRRWVEWEYRSWHGFFFRTFNIGCSGKRSWCGRGFWAVNWETRSLEVLCVEHWVKLRGKWCAKCVKMNWKPEERKSGKVIQKFFFFLFYSLPLMLRCSNLRLRELFCMSICSCTVSSSVPRSHTLPLLFKLKHTKLLSDYFPGLIPLSLSTNSNYRFFTQISALSLLQYLHLEFRDISWYCFSRAWLCMEFWITHHCNECYMYYNGNTNETATCTGIWIVCTFSGLYSYVSKMIYDAMMVIYSPSGI